MMVLRKDRGQFWLKIHAYVIRFFATVFNLANLKLRGELSKYRPPICLASWIAWDKIQLMIHETRLRVCLYDPPSAAIHWSVKSF